MNTIYNPAIHHRRSIRLRNYDYCQFGYYYVTICIHEKRHLLGEIVDSQMNLSEMGVIVELELLKTEQIREYVKIQEYVIIPNHIHAIIQIMDRDEPNDPVRARRWHALIASNHDENSPVRLTPNTLGSIICQLKSITTKQCRQSGHPEFAWHRGYHERILRNVDELFQVRQYIRANPVAWAMDKENGMCCGENGNG